MTLYWPDDPNTIDLTGPRLHAYIIGVGDYPHLKQGAPNAAGTDFGLQQLTTTVLTATRIAEWLATEYKNPAVPLGSIELLLSAPQTVTRPDTTTVSIDAATMANVKATFKPQWLKRCDANAGNIALFYFAGHGISTASQFLLLSDFADPMGALWDNVIDFDGMRSGMRSCKAATQLFFVDACRETPIDVLTQTKSPSGASLTNATIFQQVASSAVYFAAAEGLQAYGPKDDITFFATALIESLEGAGALQRQGKWTVDTFMLGTGLGHVMNAIAAETNRPLSCNPNPSGKPAIIHCPAAPQVRISIGCVTPKANAESLITLKGAQQFQSPAGASRPWKQRIAPGPYDLTVTFQTFPQVTSPGEQVGPLPYDFEVPV